MSRRTKHKAPTWTDAELKEAAKRAAAAPTKPMSMNDDAFAAALERFSAATGGEPRPIDNHADAHDEAAALVFKLEVQRTKMMEIIQRIPNHDDMVNAKFLLGEIIDTSLRLGAVKLTSDKREKLEFSLSQRRGGNGRGKQQSEAAAASWQPIALRLARAAQKEDRTLLVQEKIIDAIVLRWPPNVPCPESQLLAFIRDCQLNGKIMSSKQFRARNSVSAG
jgi:hypothetical protein